MARAQGGGVIAARLLLPVLHKGRKEREGLPILIFAVLAAFV
ncbi:hypothetical protein OPIT5_18570 [Opitutaceae bacterium TAV5]|nr:hypothetical protein OPIT5_18570 [Opitutaceae bacterium TAV5]